MAAARRTGSDRSHEGCSGRLRVGTSGYQYDHWVGDLYPESLPRGEWFARYARTFDTVEINNTFYGLPDPETFDAWRERAPEDFLYALKFSRYGTHMKAVFTVLREAGAALCIHDLVENHPREVTADWVYLRFHGRRYEGGYTHQKLTAEATRASSHLRKGRDVFAYFNNDLGGHAVPDATDFRRYVETRYGGDGGGGEGRP